MLTCDVIKVYCCICAPEAIIQGIAPLLLEQLPHSGHSLIKKNLQVEEILDYVKEEVKMEEDDEESASSSAMVLDATAEFCRSLGDIPTYGQAGNRDHASEIIVSILILRGPSFERSEVRTFQIGIR